MQLTFITFTTYTAQRKPVTTMLTYPWKCTVLHCNHLGNTWKPLVLMTRHFDYCLSASEGDNQSVGSSAPVVSRCFPGGYNVKLYISRGRLARWLLAFLHSATCLNPHQTRATLALCIDIYIQRITMCPHVYHHSGSMATPALGTRDVRYIYILESKWP